MASQKTGLMAVPEKQKTQRYTLKEDLVEIPTDAVGL
jgi:hypothetical protein